MAEVTHTVHVEVQTFDPAQGRMIPVPDAQLLIEDKGALWDPDLSDGSHTTDANGLAQVEISYDDSEENSLNPFVTVTVPEGSRTVPAGASADLQFELPEEWITAHHEQRRIPRIADHADANNPLQVYVGLPMHLRLGYSDFEASGQRNPMALPRDTATVYLSDHDYFLFDWFIFDWLDPDDTLTGPGYDPTQDQIVTFGADDRYPYFDRWPTAPFALDGLPDAPRSWLDPPGAPVGMLGGGSFDQVGPMAAGPDGFVFMVDGNRVLRFYPDGRLCEAIEAPAPGFGSPSGLALDQYGHLFVADRTRDAVHIFRPGWWDRSDDHYLHERSVDTLSLPLLPPAELDGPCGLALLANAAVDGRELLAVANSGSQDVALFEIQVSGQAGKSHRASSRLSVDLDPLAKIGTAGSNPDQFQEPVGVAADRDDRLFVCDRQLHRVSRWAIDRATGGATHEATWERPGGGSGSADGNFGSPEAIAVDTIKGYLYVAESGNLRVQRLDADSGATHGHWEPEVSGTPARPQGLGLDPRGELYLADGDNRRVHRGSPFAADGSSRGDAEEPRAVAEPWTPRDSAAHMQAPEYLMFDDEGRLWVSDTGNDRVLVFEADADGELVVNDALGAPDSDLDQPVGLAMDPDDMLFVVDSANHRIRRYSGSPLSHQAPDIGSGSAGSADNEFDDPRGLAIVQRTEPLLYVADRDNNRVQVLQRDGSFVKSLSLPAGDAFDAPEDVAADARGNIYVADTGNGRIVQFDAEDNHVRAFPVPTPTLTPGATPALPPGVTPAPSGISVDDEQRLLISDRLQNRVFRSRSDGTLLSWWDLKNLLRQNHSSDDLYDPELARQLLFLEPARAVSGAGGLLAVADTGRDRVRLVRGHTDLRANLTEWGEELPDIMLHVKTKADWSAELGLELNVGDVSLFDDSHDFESEPLEEFAEDRYEQTQLLGNANSTSAAINVMKVVRQVQGWYQHHTRLDEAEFRWGNPDEARTLDVDLVSGTGSWQVLDVNLGMESPEGRGPDAWDDSVLVHEMTHWVFYKAVQPYMPFTIVGALQLTQSHRRSQLTSENLAISEAWGEFVQLSWGSEFGAHDRLRGFKMPPDSGAWSARLRNVSESGSAPYQYLFGGPESNPLPSFDESQLALRNEGYTANALYQIHHALCCPEVRFADAPGYWWGFNVNLSDDQSQRFSDTLWRALRMFPEDPPSEELDRANLIYLRNLLRAFHDHQPDFARMVQSIFELNNLLMPVIRITEGDSESEPGTALGETVELEELGTKSLVVQVSDASGHALEGCNLHVDVTDPLDYDLSPADPGGRAHGRVVSGSGLNRVTNAHGIVRLTYEAPPSKSAGSSELLRVVYQPDFDNDDSFAPPQPGDDQETTLRKLYLRSLSSAAKTWEGSGNNYGARVVGTLTFNIVSS